MDQTHVDSQFQGLIDRTWLPIEAQALEATAYETVTVSADTVHDALQAAYDALRGDRALASAGVPGGKRARHAKPRKRLWLPVIAYLRGDIYRA